MATAADASAAAEQDNNSNSNNNNNSKRQRFAEEPKDGLCLFGQQAELSCAVEHKQGSLTWLRDTVGLGMERISKSYSNEYSLQIERSPPDKPALANYSLRVHQVSLEEDAHFTCLVSSAEGQPEIRSRQARLTVLKAPARLLVDAHRNHQPQPFSSAALADERPPDDSQQVCCRCRALLADET